jgi:thioredoxin 1
MISRRLILAAALALASSAPALALEPKTYNAAVFQAALKAGKSILVEIHASWCPTCKAQIPILSDLTADPKFKDLVVYRVDFDSQKSAVKYFHAQIQSTLIAFKGGKETARSAGDTHRKSIAALLNSAI